MVEVIQSVNVDEYAGSGLVCSLHFQPTEIKSSGDRFLLSPNVIPSIFDYMIDIIDIDTISTDTKTDSHVCKECEKHRKATNDWKEKTKMKNNQIMALDREITALKKLLVESNQKNEELLQKVSSFLNPTEEIVSPINDWINQSTSSKSSNVTACQPQAFDDF